MKEPFWKRPFDFMLALFVGIILFSPLWLLFILMIWIKEGRPIFYTQERVGKDGRIFRVIKFRSMIKDAEKHTGAVWTKENDPRITAVGRILRSRAMDELPQVLSILKGDMSFVGPRALVVDEQILLEKQIPGFEKRLAVRPGLTGLAQVYNPEDEPYRKLELDLEYINNMSLYLDIKLILLSCWNTFTARWDKRSGKKVQQGD